MVGKIKITRWRKAFALQGFARNFAKIEYPKSQKDYRIGSEEAHINDKYTFICVKI